MNLKEYFNKKIFSIDEVINAIKHAEKHEINFYAFRLPNDNKAYFGASLETCTNLNTEGFLIAPFQESEYNPRIIIPNHFGINFPQNLPLKRIIEKTDTPSTDKNYYIESTQKLIDELKHSPQPNKVVISKIITHKSFFDVANLFKLLCTTYNHAFVFCYYTPNTGMWIGASPEQLLCSQNNQITSMSLAGTRKAETNETWSKKNIIEQQIVTDYISQTFSNHGFSPNVSERFTKQAGPVEHLCCTITANNTKSDIILWNMIKDLSPTPALAGYPKEYAINKIKQIEHHNRLCYGGYIGPIINNSEFAFYVNLRSLQIHSSHYTIFVGGGITPDSNAEDEWDETEIKASTLLNLIKKCENQL